MEPPVAPKHQHVTVVHGDTLRDEYFWLRDKSTPEVTEYLHAEDAYANEVMKPLMPLRDTLYDEILSHIKQTDEDAPYPEGDYVYYKRTEEGHQYPVYCRKGRTEGGSEEVLLDLNTLARGYDFFSLGVMAVSDDGTRLAYSTDTLGYRQYMLYVKDLNTGAILDPPRERVDDVVWASDNRTLFYVVEDPVTKRADKFFRHIIGSGTEELVLEEKDELFDLGAYRSRDKKFVFVQSSSKTSTEVRFVDATQPAAQPRIIAPREPDHEYDVAHSGNRFYIRTNKGALNFRVVTAPEADPSPHNWSALIPHRPSVMITGVETFSRYLVLSEMEEGLDQIEITDLEGKNPYRITYPEPVYRALLSQNRIFDTDVLRYSYQSLVTPPSVLEFSMKTHQTALIKQTEVPGGFDENNYASERIFATANDGTRIPISIVYRKGFHRGNPAPMFLNGYGSYGLSYPVYFSGARLALLDRGVIWAIAHVRGGGELGEEWRNDGRMMKKMNTFTDFIECAQYLISEQYTASDRLVIGGGSAGGMLMGAATNMRPDLFKAVITTVPFVDIVNTMLDASLPLTTGEYIEWGNPAEKPAFDYIMRYSPYDNVKRQAYPAMLVKVSMHDSQVPYWEGAKLVAKLRTVNTGSLPILLKVNFDSGHGGYSGRYDAYRDVAFDYAFALSQMGVKPALRP